MIPLLEGFKLIKSLRAGNSRYKRKKKSLNTGVGILEIRPSSFKSFMLDTFDLKTSIN